MFPIKYKDVLKREHLIDIYQLLDERWSFSNVSFSQDGGRFWTHRERNIPEFMDVATRVKLKVLRDLKRPIRLLRIQINGQTCGSGSTFHWDYTEDDVWTFVLFTTPSWDFEWGAEFVCLNPDTREFQYIAYEPNTGVLIPSNWYHKGCAPNYKTQKLRTSLAFTYVAEEKYYDMLSRNPDLLCFR